MSQFTYPEVGLDTRCVHNKITDDRISNLEYVYDEKIMKFNFRYCLCTVEKFESFQYWLIRMNGILNMTQIKANPINV